MKKNSSPAFAPVGVLDFGHSNSGVVLSCFSLSFPGGMHCGASSICIFSLVRCLLWSLAHFIIWLLVFLLLILRLLSIFRITPWSGMSLTSTFFQSVAGLIILLIFCRAEIFNFSEVEFIHSFFHGSFLWCCVEKVTAMPNHNHLGFLLCYILGVYSFMFFI